MITRVFMLISILLTANGMAVNSTKSLSLKQAIDLALDYSYEVRKQNVERAKLDDSYRETLAGILPQISLESSMKRYIDGPSIMGMPLNKDYEASYGLTVSQTVYAFGVVTNALDAAEAAIKLQGHINDTAKREIIYATKLSYLGVLMSQRQLEIAELSLANARSNYETLQKLFATGRPPQSDLLRINTDIARKIPEVTNAKSNVKIAQSRLKYLLGLDQNVLLILTDNLNHSGNINLEKQSDELFDQHPHLQYLEKNIELQTSLAKVQRSATLPMIGAFYSWNQSIQSDEILFENDQKSKTSLAGVQLKWSLWDGGGGRAKHHRALKEKSLAEIRLAEAKENFRAELTVISEELPALKENLEATRNALSLAEKSLEMSRNRFKYGKTSVLELNDAETIFVQLKLGEALAMFKLHEAQAKLDKIINHPVGPRQKGIE